MLQVTGYTCITPGQQPLQHQIASQTLVAMASKSLTLDQTAPLNRGIAHHLNHQTREGDQQRQPQQRTPGVQPWVGEFPNNQL